jgi:PTS system fructose-specific IIC component
MSAERHLLAITACPSGVAHTYMAAENLEQAARRLGYTMDVETHGSIGVEGAFSPDAINRAEAVIIAADSKIDLARFEGKKVVVTGVAEGIHKPEDLIRRGLEAKPLAPSGAQSKATQQRTGIYGILMNGVSHMIPFVVVGGLLIAIAYGIGGVPGPTGLAIPEGSFYATLAGLGGLGFTLMVPILSGFIAYAIADRPGLAPGMITGMLAMTPALYNSDSGAGFMGGIVTGLLSGYVALAIKKIPVHKYLAPIWPIIVIPIGTSLIVGLTFIYVLGGPIAFIFTGLTSWLAGMQGVTPIFLGLILGSMIGFDMGGPVNKVAYLFAGGLIATGNFIPQGMTSVAIAVPPIGMFIATLIARKLFDDSERESGIAAAFMGFFGITEGAIPFAAAHPLSVIPANIVGSAVGAALAGVLGVESHVMWGGLIVAVLGGVGQPLLFVLCIAVGSAVTALIAVTLMRIGSRRKPAAGDPLVAKPVDVAPLSRSVPSPIGVAPATGGGVAAATLTRPATVLDYISEDTIVLDSAATDRDAMIRELVALGVRTGQVADADVVLASALAREALMSTAVGEGIAIPHAKSAGAARPMVAFAKARNLDWASPSGDLARLVFLISVPEADAGDEHLRILAKLSRALARPAVRDALTDATTKPQVLEVLRGAVD